MNEKRNNSRWNGFRSNFNDLFEPNGTQWWNEIERSMFSPVSINTIPYRTIPLKYEKKNKRYGHIWTF